MAVGADDAAIIAAGIQAAGAIGSTIGMNVKKRGTRRMLAVSKELAAYNTKLSENMYNLYQSPAAQVRQYRQAGLNPNLLANGAASGSPQAGQVDTDASKYGMEPRESVASVAGAAVRDAVGGIQNYLMNDAKISNDVASAEALRSQAQLNDLKAEGQKIQNSLDEVLSSYRVEEMNQNNALRAIELDVQNRYALINARAKYQNLLENTYLTKRQQDEITSKIGMYDQQIKESEARVKNYRDTIALGYGNLALARDKFNFESNMRTEQQSFYEFNANRDWNLRHNQFEFNKKREMAGQLFNIITPKQPIIHDLYMGIRGSKEAVRTAKQFYGE